MVNMSNYHYYMLFCVLVDNPTTTTAITMHNNLRAKNTVLNKWNRYLSSILSSEHWYTKFYKNLDAFSYQFVDMLSRIAAKNDQIFKFMLVGACDGDSQYDTSTLVASTAILTGRVCLSRPMNQT